MKTCSPTIVGGTRRDEGEAQVVAGRRADMRTWRLLDGKHGSGLGERPPPEVLKEEELYECWNGTAVGKLSVELATSE